MRAARKTPKAVASGRSLLQPALREVPDAITVRASASNAERLARLTSQHGRTAAGTRPANRRQLLNLAGAVACSDLELAVLALHGTSQYAAAARLAAATGEALAYSRALAVKHSIVAEHGDKHRYAVALRAFTAEDRQLTHRADVLGGWLGEHWDAQTGMPASDDDFEPDAYLRLLAAEHRLVQEEGGPTAEWARAALWSEAHSLQISARRLAAWARVTAEWLCPGLDQIAPPWVTDPRLLSASHALIN
ncbi:hypothetical protein ABH935_007064 [Catenulispora sp. GAS73]|uniref:hypothetical protein n=1 Tax=Catenulispora sp. GAS73 TaxID=3156269 RepID=UPI00351457EB